MSFLGRIKSLLPPSSRSFHAMHEDLARQTDQIVALRAELAECRRELSDFRGVIFERSYQLEGNVGKRVDGLGAQLGMYAWPLLQRDGETILATKQRFFASLEPAQGGLRLMQLGCAALLHEFDALCQENGLDYWVDFGTLLGAVRHGGFIPWDDDTDLGMMRADIYKLKSLVEKSDRYKLSIAYDPNVCCRQIRFMYRDGRVPCFLDLFTFDYVRSCDAHATAAHEQARRDVCAAFRQDAAFAAWLGGEECLVEGGANAGLADAVSGAFDAKLAELYAEGGLLTADPSEAAGVIWGIDNMDYGCCIPAGDVFPTTRLDFEGFACSAPHNSGKFLSEAYGDIYSLPGDIRSHFEHVSKDDLRSAEFESLMRDFFGEKNNTPGNQEV